MTNKLTDYLINLDITENEAKLYFKLLATGPLDVRTLAKVLKIKRTTIYNYIHKLIERRLLMKMVRKSRTLFAANTPAEVMTYLVEQRVQESKKLQESLPAFLKHITDTIPHKEEVIQAEIKYYTGKPGVKKIYKEALRAKKLRSYANLEEIEVVFPQNFQLFDNAFMENPEIEMFEIVEQADFSQTKSDVSQNAGNERYHYKFFPKNKKMMATDILIYDGNVAFIDLKDETSCVVIYNNSLYNSFVLLFDTMWEMLPEI